jgi:glutamate-ammonia-ligase adenylyltransferase
MARDQLLSIESPLTRPVLKDHWHRHWPEALAAGLSDTADNGFAQALRQYRNAVMLAIMARDLGGLSDLHENLQSISDLAEICLNLGYQHCCQAMVSRHGVARRTTGEAVDLLIVGMGKLGGYELNASSDIDLIYLLADEGQSDGRPKDHPDGPGGALDLQTYFTRLGRRLAGLLGESTADGLVFRVDLRLRPHGDSGPVVCSFEMLENYLIRYGREWERYAWIKARLVNKAVLSEQDQFEKDARLLETIRRPFVFRRYLDFNALAALRDLHGQIREEAQRRSQRREARMAGDYEMVDVKLGPGGIREIEFIGQLFQLIRGGRDPALQSRVCLEVLKLLRDQARISEKEYLDLCAAYEFWRRLEHRLQYEEDAQTHVLSGSTKAYSKMAQAMGLESAEALCLKIEAHRSHVIPIFEKLFRKEAPGLDKIASETKDADNFGETAPGSEPPTPRANDADSRLERLRLRIKAIVRGHTDAQRLERGLNELVDSLRRRSSYLALFDEYPETLERVAKVMATSSWAASYMQRHPIVLDELLDRRGLDEAGDLDRLAAQLHASLEDAQLNGEPDVERQMDILRETHHGQLFRLLVQDLDGLLSVEHLSDRLSGLADVMIDATLRSAWKATPRRHRQDPQFAVIAYGKLGGKELGYASDLDLIFLHNDTDDMAQEVYARLAKRINVWLSTNTAAGSLFEIDLRLRPNGNAGLLVTDLPGFIDYQEKRAWVWEHQALTRARFCAGDAAIGQAFEQARIQILRQPRQPQALQEEILAMRRRMHDGHPNPSGQFDLKHDRAGMVDIEFMVQALVLEHSHAHAELTGNLGNIALLTIAAGLGLVEAEKAQKVAEAYRRFRRSQHRLRLAGASSARVAPDAFEADRQAVKDLWHEVFDKAPNVIRSLSEIRGKPS